MLKSISKSESTQRTEEVTDDDEGEYFGRNL